MQTNTFTFKIIIYFLIVIFTLVLLLMYKNTQAAVNGRFDWSLGQADMCVDATDSTNLPRFDWSLGRAQPVIEYSEAAATRRIFLIQ